MRLGVGLLTIIGLVVLIRISIGRESGSYMGYGDSIPSLDAS